MSSYKSHMGCRDHEYTPIGRKEKYKCLCYLNRHTGLGIKFVLAALYRSSRRMTFQTSYIEINTLKVA